MFSPGVKRGCGDRPWERLARLQADGGTDSALVTLSLGVEERIWDGIAAGVSNTRHVEGKTLHSLFSPRVPEGIGMGFSRFSGVQAG